MTFITIIFLIILITLVFSDSSFSKSFSKDYHSWSSKLDPNAGITGKILVGALALAFAFITSSVKVVYTRLDIPKKQIEDNPTERYQSFCNTLDKLIRADWENADGKFRSVTKGWQWIDGNLYLYLVDYPSKKELEKLLNRIQSYAKNWYGWGVTGLSAPYQTNLGTNFSWTVMVVITDLITKNKSNMVLEQARIERQKEVEYLPSPISKFNDRRISELKMSLNHFSLPLWADRKGKYELITLSHTLLCGATGSGKSNALLYWAHCIWLLMTDEDELFILDYKQGKDWSGLRGASRYYSVERAKEGFEKLYFLFHAYLDGTANIGNKVIYVIIDELSSLVEAYTDKKERSEFQRRLGEMLRLSRNLGDLNGGFRLIVGLQQADAKYFGGTEIRGNFRTRIGLGGMTEEGRRMLFEVIEEGEKPKSSPAGKGFAQIDGKPIQKIMIPYEENKEFVLARVRSKLERP